MNATALSLVLAAAVVHAAWNLAAKRVSSGGPQFVWLYYTVSAVVLLPVTVVLLAVEPQRPQWSWLLAARSRQPVFARCSARFTWGAAATGRRRGAARRAAAAPRR